MSSSVSLMEVDSYKEMPVLTEDKDSTDCKWFDLIPNRDLLDSSFEGYKLSLDKFSQHKTELREELQPNTYTFIDANSNESKIILYQHLKLYGFQNLLVCNQFNDSSLYYFDKSMRLIKIDYALSHSSSSTGICLVPTTFQLPVSELVVHKDRANPTIKFANKSTAAVYDGYNTLYICQITSESSSQASFASEKWSIVHKWQSNKSDHCANSLLRDAITLENCKRTDVLLMCVEDSDDKPGKFNTLINWLTFHTVSDALGEWSLKRLRRINCMDSVPEYVSLERTGESLYVAGPSSIRFVYDSLKSVGLVEKEVLSMPCDDETQTPPLAPTAQPEFYTWTQSKDELNVKVYLSRNEHLMTTPSRNENDIQVEFKNDRIDIRTGDEWILRGKLYASIKADLCVWSLQNNSTIEVRLAKAISGSEWPYLLAEQETIGKRNASNGERLQINNQASLFSLEQELEECDGIVDEQMNMNLQDEEKFLMFRRLDGESHQSTFKCYINDNKYLFETYLEPAKSAAVCLRHDVDGILWQPHRILTSKEPIWMTHEFTFMAMGYVQASKTNCKYSICSPNLAYVCICDAQKHIYVYGQRSTKLEGELRNRKSGQLVSHVFKQYLISLDTDEEIRGAYAANDYLVLLLKDACYTFKMNFVNS
jgi:hypothetical protein